MAETQTVEFEELHDRLNDGIHVRLMINNAVEPPEFRVDVDDSKQGETFSVSVKPGQRPMEVFIHPFSYAGDRLINASVHEAVPEEAVFSD